MSGIIFVARLCTFSILSMSRHKCRDQNCTAYSRCGRTRDVYSRRFNFLFLYLILWAMNSSTLLTVLQLSYYCSSNVRSLVMMIPRSCCWQVSLAQVCMWNDLPYTACVRHQTLDIDLREQSTVGRFPDLCLFQFSVAQALVRLRKQFIYNLFFSNLGLWCWF